jgi:hypothetical protein
VFQNTSAIVCTFAGPNPLTVNYNVTSSLVHFEKKNIFYSMKNALVYYIAGVGLAPGVKLF